MTTPRPFRKVLVLGMDGLDPFRIDAMIEEGNLPAFARLRETGTLSPLLTSNPAESPVAWSCLATGTDPGQHGVFDFIHRNPNGYVPFLSTHLENGARRGPATASKSRDRFHTPRHRPGFWRYTSDAGLPTTVIRWPVTFPAEEVNGNFLAGLGVPDVTGRMGKHTFYTTAAVPPDDEKAVHVEWKNDRIETHLFGPLVPGLRGAKPTRVAMTIDKAAEGIVLTIGQQQQALTPRQWSDWFHVRFKWGPMALGNAIVKFYLVNAGPELRLFATPLQVDPAQQLFPLTCPESYGAELAADIGPFYTLGLPEDTHAVTDGRYDLNAFLDQCAEISRQRWAMLHHELSRFDEGLLAFVFDTSDRIQHMFWSIADEASPAYDPKRAQEYAHIVDDLYREMDDALNLALEESGDETAIFVVSDHGFGPFRRAVNLNRWLIENGWMSLKEDAPGRNLFADVDWSRTHAYAVGFTSLYLNIAGRESNGIIDPDDAAGMGSRLVEHLRQAIDPDTETPMIRDVYPASEMYHGRHVADGPDLVVGYQPGYRASWQTALGGAPEGVVVNNDSLWAADHLVDPESVPGVLGSNVPFQHPRPTVLDLAPTVLACLGLEVPSHMCGTLWIDPSAEHPHRPQLATAHAERRNATVAEEEECPVPTEMHADGPEPAAADAGYPEPATERSPDLEPPAGRSDRPAPSGPPSDRADSSGRRLPAIPSVAAAPEELARAEAMAMAEAHGTDTPRKDSDLEPRTDAARDLVDLPAPETSDQAGTESAPHNRAEPGTTQETVHATSPGACSDSGAEAETASGTGATDDPDCAATSSTRTYAAGAPAADGLTDEDRKAIEQRLSDLGYL